MSTSDTLELVKQALSKSNEDPALAKAFLQSGSATSGLTAYDLEAPAKTLYPVLTPLRNMLPRVSGRGGIQANWRAITAINTTNVNAGVSEGNRGGVISTEVKDYLAAYKGIGLEDYVTFEADYAAQGFDDVKARATQGLLRSVMIQEERILLGGNGTVALGTTPTPTVAAVASGGSLAPSTSHSVICVALTLDGFNNSSVANGVVDTISRTNADGSNDTVAGGAAQQSAAATATTSAGATDSIEASVAPVSGAVAYAWYLGTSGGTERLAAITTINSVKIGAINGSGQLASALAAADNSSNNLVFDGFFSIIAKAGSGGYWNALPTGTPGTGNGLTADTSGGIEEFDTVLQHFWDNYRLSPTMIYVSSQEMNWVRKKILDGSTTAVQRFSFSANQQGFLGGTRVEGYVNPFTMGDAEEIPIRIHPNMPAGTVLFLTQTLPYPLSGVSNVNQVRVRQEYYSLEWPQRSRKYEYGVYADEVLQCYAPFSMGVLTNIAPA